MENDKSAPERPRIIAGKDGKIVPSEFLMERMTVLQRAADKIGAVDLKFNQKTFSNEM